MLFFVLKFKKSYKNLSFFNFLANRAFCTTMFCRNASYCSHSTFRFAEMLLTAATALSALQKCFLLQPQHSQLCRHASYCSNSTLSLAEMLPTAATARSVLQKCFPLQPRHFQIDRVRMPDHDLPTGHSAPFVMFPTDHFLFIGLFVCSSCNCDFFAPEGGPHFELNFDRVSMPQTSTRPYAGP